MYKTIRLMLVALVLGLLLAGCSSGKTTGEGLQEGYRIGNLAPDFVLKDPAGQTVSLGQFRGQPVFLNFWASWCPPCREEMPLIQQIHDDKALTAKGLVILGIDIGEDVATVTNFMKSNGYSFPVLLDTRQEVADDYNIRSIPTTFFIDKDGVIKDVRIGAFPNKSQMMTGLNKIIQ